jgi:hypothetical protein
VSDKDIVCLFAALAFLSYRDLLLYFSIWVSLFPEDILGEMELSAVCRRK